MDRKEGKMDFNQIMDISNVEFGQMPPQAFLIGLLSAFDNRYQASADSFFKEITWKQFFAIICINLCKESPTINELSDIMGSSHQNVKQILNKLEGKNFVQMIPDPKDKRKQRIILTDWCRTFCEKNDVQSQKMMAQLFEGIGEEQLLITIQTIMQMERNLKKL
ncbi:MAG: MarR family winged helix-turn-helix transcriptional regulator [Lachnospiraceae bacterium]